MLCISSINGKKKLAFLESEISRLKETPSFGWDLAHVKNVLEDFQTNFRRRDADVEELKERFNNELEQREKIGRLSQYEKAMEFRD